MFNVRYDLTKGMLRRRASTRLAGAVGTSKMRKADMCATAPSGGAGGGGGGGFGPAGMGVDQRYSPVFDRAEVPNLGQQFLPADTQSQNKIFRQIVTFDPIVGSALEYWRDLAFSDAVVLGGIKDEKVLQLYQDAIDASGIVAALPDLLYSFLSMGRFVFHMTMNESLGYWDRIIAHDLDYVSIQASPMSGADPLIDLMPTDEQKKWALSKDPRVIATRRTFDPVLVKFMAAGKKIPLAPENTMFLPRSLFPWDRMGMSMLTRVLLFVVYEAAIFNASVAGARRRAGPLWHITAWEDAADNELTDLLNMFMAAEEDPVGAKVVTKSGVTVNPVGGGSGDYWKLSDEWDFLTQGKMRALGTSETFLCLSGSTLLPTVERGLVRIDSLGDCTKKTAQDLSVGTLGRYGETAKTSKWISRGTAPTTVRLTSKHGYTIRSTPEHRIQTLNSLTGALEWKQAKDFGLGDLICMSSQACTRSTSLELDLPDRPVSSRERNTKQPTKPTCMTEDLAFLLGMLVSEGCHDRYRVRISNSDLALLKKTERCVHNVFGLSATTEVQTVKGRKFVIAGVKTKSNKSCYALTINSAVLAYWMTHLGVVPGGDPKWANKQLSWVKEVPWSILQADATSQLAYLAAYIEGDGTICRKNRSISFYSRSNKNLHQLHIMLAAHGIFSNLMKRYHRIDVNSEEAARLFDLVEGHMVSKSRKRKDTSYAHGSARAGVPVTFIGKLLDDRFVRKEPNKGKWYRNDLGEEVLVPRAGQLLAVYCGVTKRIHYESYKAGVNSDVLGALKLISTSTHGKLVKLLTLAYRFDEISSVKELGPAKVYDICMRREEEPAFTANGMVVHNSGEANWNSMDTIRTVYLEKLGTMRSFMTKKVILDKMLSQLAVMNDFTQRTAAEISHRIRIGRPKTVDDPRLMLPTIEWSRPLTPTKDQEYLDILETVKNFGLPPNLRTVAQAAGVDIDKELDNLPANLEVLQKIYSYQRSLAQMQKQMGVNAEGVYEGGGADLGAGDIGMGDMGGGGFDLGGLDEAPGGMGGGGGEGLDLGGPPETPTAPTEAPGGGGGAAPPTTAPGAPAEPAGGPGGAGASSRTPRFSVKPPVVPKERYAKAPRDVLAQLKQLPLWDERDSLFGVPMRRAAEILDRIGRSDPSGSERIRLADTLHRNLRTSGFDQLQSEALEYLAMRLGYLPKMSLSAELYDVLSKMALSKMNGHGLTAAITNELIAISRISGEKPQREPQLSNGAWPRNNTDYIKALYKGEQSLGHNQILTGRIDPKRDLMPTRKK